MRKILKNVFFLAVLAAASPARAQDIGNVGFRSVAATVASGTACTGSAQTFSTSSSALNALGFRNLGQTQHYASINAPTTTALKTEIDGVDNFGNVVRISEVLEGPGLATPSLLQASGYYPNIQIVVTCLPVTANFTLAYAGTWATFNGNSGGYLQSQLDKILFTGAAANTTASATFQTPYANSLGAIQFSFAGSGPSGSSLVVTCFGILSANALTIQLSTAASIQTFPINLGGCPNVTVQYVSGGASAATYSLEYIFSAPGAQSIGVLGGGSTVASVCTPSGSAFVSCNPTQLGVNALTEPGSGTTALSTIIDTRGAKQATISFSCTQGAITLNVQEYAEDGSTALALVSPLSAVAASTNAQLTMGSESNPNSNTGTLSTSALVRLPQRALAFSFTNASVTAGTCTARLFVSY